VAPERIWKWGEGGTGPENFFGRALHFLALKVQLFVSASAFVVVTTVWSVSFLLLFYSRCPPCPAICKSGWHVPPCPMEPAPLTVCLRMQTTQTHASFEWIKSSRKQRTIGLNVTLCLNALHWPPNRFLGRNAWANFFSWKRLNRRDPFDKYSPALFRDDADVSCSCKHSVAYFANALQPVSAQCVPHWLRLYVSLSHPQIAVYQMNSTICTALPVSLTTPTTVTNDQTLIQTKHNRLSLERNTIPCTAPNQPLR